MASQTEKQTTNGSKQMSNAEDKQKGNDSCQDISMGGSLQEGIAGGFCLGQADMFGGLPMRGPAPLSYGSMGLVSTSLASTLSMGQGSAADSKESKKFSLMAGLGKKSALLRKLMGSKKNQSVESLPAGFGSKRKKHKKRSSKSFNGSKIDEISIDGDSDSSDSVAGIPSGVEATKSVKKEKRKSLFSRKLSHAGKLSLFNKKEETKFKEGDANKKGANSKRRGSLKNLQRSIRSKIKPKLNLSPKEVESDDCVDGIIQDNRRKLECDDDDDSIFQDDCVDGIPEDIPSDDYIDFDEEDEMRFPGDVFDYDPVWKLVNSPKADILQVLMCATDQQLLREMGEFPTIPPIRSNTCSLPQNELSKTSPGAKTFLRHASRRFNRNRPKSHFSVGFDDNDSPPSSHSQMSGKAQSTTDNDTGEKINQAPSCLDPNCPCKIENNTDVCTSKVQSKVQMRARSGTVGKSFADVRKSIHQRVNLEEDNLYKKVNAACKRAKTISDEKHKLRLKASVKFEKQLHELDKNEQEMIEKEIAMILRAKGDAVTKEMPDIAPAVKEIVKDVAYSKFNEVMEDTIGHKPGWTQVVSLVNITRSAVSWVGQGTSSAFKIKECTLKYFEDNFSSWVVGQGGWDSLVEGSTT